MAHRAHGRSRVRYTYVVEKSATADEYVGTCLEFPGLQINGSDFELTMNAIKGLIGTHVAACKSQGVALPAVHSWLAPRSVVGKKWGT